MGVRRFQAGDWVTFKKQKTSTSPGPRAQDMTPTTKGDTYSYIVVKYWVVEEVFDTGHVGLRTKRGKQHVLAQDDPRLRKARWWERWMFQGRFRAALPEPNRVASHAS